MVQRVRVMYNRSFGRYVFYTERAVK